MTSQAPFRRPFRIIQIDTNAAKLIIISARIEGIPTHLVNTLNKVNQVSDRNQDKKISN